MFHCLSFNKINFLTKTWQTWQTPVWRYIPIIHPSPLEAEATWATNQDCVKNSLWKAAECVGWCWAQDHPLRAVWLHSWVWRQCLGQVSQSCPSPSLASRHAAWQCFWLTLLTCELVLNLGLLSSPRSLHQKCYPPTSCPGTEHLSPFQDGAWYTWLLFQHAGGQGGG